jgi:polysaccharide export outer membrane protein
MRLLMIFTLLASSLGLAACVEDDFMSVPPKDPAERALGGPAISATAYRLTVGDHVRVTIFGATAVTTEYTVDDTGAIAVPPMGPIAIKELTTAEAAALIAKKYTEGGLYRDPRVTVDVASFGPFYMLGEVAKPGEFQYRPGMSLFAAVATAGGYTYRASRERVFIRKAGEAIETEYELDADIAILPGDVIRIPDLRL